MPTRYADRAVRAVQSYLSTPVTGLEQFLRAYETETGLAVNTLENPSAYVRGFMPHDTRSPLIQIYEGSLAPVGDGGNRNRLSAVDVTIALSYTGDADVEATEDKMRGYLSALILAIAAAPTLGGLVSAAWWTDADRSHPMIDQESVIRHVRALGVQVQVHDP